MQTVVLLAHPRGGHVTDGVAVVKIGGARWQQRRQHVEGWRLVIASARVVVVVVVVWSGEDGVDVSASTGLDLAYAAREKPPFSVAPVCSREYNSSTATLPQ